MNAEEGASAPERGRGAFSALGKNAVYILLFIFYRCRILITTIVEGECIMKEMTALPDGELEIMQRDNKQVFYKKVEK